MSLSCLSTTSSPLSLKVDLMHAGCIITRCLLLANLIVCIFCLHTDVMNEGSLPSQNNSAASLSGFFEGKGSETNSDALYHGEMKVFRITRSVASSV